MDHRSALHRTAISALKLDLGSSIMSWLSTVGIPTWIVVIFVAMLPFVELRGSIPLAMVLFDMPLWQAFILSIIGNMVPIPFILFGFHIAEKILRKIPTMNRFFDWLFRKKKAGAGTDIQRFREIALIIFVAIPLPFTGAWTGALLAYLYKFNKVRAFVCIFLGVVGAGIIVSGIMILGYGNDILGYWGIVYAVEVIAILFAFNKLLGQWSARSAAKERGKARAK